MLAEAVDLPAFTPDTRAALCACLLVFGRRGRAFRVAAPEYVFGEFDVGCNSNVSGISSQVTSDGVLRDLPECNADTFAEIQPEVEPAD